MYDSQTHGIKEYNSSCQRLDRSTLLCFLLRRCLYLYVICYICLGHLCHCICPRNHTWRNSQMGNCFSVEVQSQSLSVGYITFTSVQYFGLGEDHSQLMVWYHLHKARQALSQFQHVVSTRETNLKSRIIERQFKSVEMAQPSVERGLCSYHIESNPKASFPISLQLSYTNFWKFLFSIPQHYL